jgi:outer membrane biosynthesis protein TonB
MKGNRGLKYSALFHGLLLFFLLFGLPSFFHRELDKEPVAISVDILPIAPISNVKNQEKAPEKIEEKKPVEEKKTAKKAITEVHKEESKKSEEPLPIPLKVEPAKKVEKKKPEKEKKKEKKDDLDSILKAVKDEAKADQSEKPTEQKKAEPNKHPAKSDHYDASQPMSMNEKDAIRNQFQKCWDVPAGAKDAQNLVVTLHIEVNEDGSVSKVEMARDEGRYHSDGFFQAAADSAMRAVRRCSPLHNLPQEKYSTWRDMELTFDPKEMLN